MSKRSNRPRPSRGRKPQRPEGNRSQNEQKTSGKDYTDNDVIWYGETPALIRDTASFAYGYPVGEPFIFASEVTAGEYGFDELPGVCVLKLGPSVGTSRDFTSPINLAAQSMYTSVVQMNSRTKTYDPTDQMLVVLASDSIYSAYSWGCRIYGLVRQYNHVNRYWPRAILEAEGVDYDSFANNYAQFRAYLDLVARRCAAWAMPNTLPIMARHTWMFSNVYCDAPTTKGQLYLYSPSYFWKYDELSEGGGRLVPQIIPSDTRFTFDMYKEMMDDLLEAVTQSQDFGTISGDFLKAYDESKLVKLSLVPVDYQTPIVYNPEVLTQIQNATIIPNATNLLNLQVTQDTAINGKGLLFDPSTVATSNSRFVSWSSKLLTMPHDNVTPEETMVATRLTVMADSDNGVVTYHTGTEICTSMIVAAYYPNSNGIGVYLRKHTYYGVLNFTSAMTALAIGSDAARYSDFNEVVRQIAVVEKFASHPALPIVVRNGGSNSSPTSVTSTMLQDIDNFTTIDSRALFEMHQAALLSELAVPILGLSSK